MKYMQYKIIIEPDENSFHAYCPELSGLHTCGDTEEEALANVKDAIRAYLLSQAKHKEIPFNSVPYPSILL